MQKIIIVLLGVLICTGISCNDDPNDFDLSKNPLKGQIEGVDWVYLSGRADYLINTNQYEALLLPVDPLDPCGVRISGDPHLLVRFPAKRQSNTIGFNYTDLVFITKNRQKELACYAGFIDIVYVSNLEIIGALSAEFDDNTKVEGSFSIRLCN